MGDNKPPVLESDSWCRTTIGDKASTSFTWTIEDFLNRPEEFGEFIVSSSFTVSGPNDLTTWELNLYPKGDILSPGNYVAFDLSNKERNTEKAHFSLSILNERGQKEKTANFLTDDYMRATERGKLDFSWSCFCSIQELKNNPNLLPNGKLTLVCDLTVYGPDKTTSGSKFPDEIVAPVNNSYKQLSEHFGKLFNNKTSSDAKIMCGNEEFFCHKIILSVRSPVFEAMFQTDMIENNREVVLIQDIKPEVVKEMLHFIYTGVVSTENVMDEIGKDLLSAADQYQLEILKSKCEEKLCSSLEVSNSIELLVLAELHKAYKLRRMALRLVIRNMDTIVDTDVYEELVKHHPGLTMEITRSLVKK